MIIIDGRSADRREERNATRAQETERAIVLSRIHLLAVYNDERISRDCEYTGFVVSHVSAMAQPIDFVSSM